jgi:hypothetical protein
MSVKVGVRVRPFNQREIDLNCKLCVDMVGNMTRLYDPNNPDDKHRDFTFDYSFWSHDQFIVDENGYFMYFSCDLDLKTTNMLTRGTSSNKWGSKFYRMPGMAIIVVCSPTGRPGRESLIQWSDTVPIRYLL